MPTLEYQKIITTDPQVKNGEPCIRGLPITVDEVLKSVSSQTPIKQVLLQYPQLTVEDIRACLEFIANKPTGTYLPWA